MGHIFKENWIDNAPNWLKEVEHYAEDIGYGIANMFGQGENANKLVNTFKGWLNNSAKKTLTSADLVAGLTKILGGRIKDLQKVINYIDNKLSSLPVALSGNMKRALSGARAKLLDQRAQASVDLNKAESALSAGQSMALSQDTLTPSKKQENQKYVEEVLSNSAPTSDYSNIIERRIN